MATCFSAPRRVRRPGASWWTTQSSADRLLPRHADRMRKQCVHVYLFVDVIDIVFQRASF
jgi:hypothetical protein